jgi:hypothetical protein
MPAGKEPHREEGRTLCGRPHTRRRTTMNRRGLWAGGLALIVLVVVGAAALTSVGAGYAKDEDASRRAKCSVATLKGTYLFAADGVEIKGNDQIPASYAGYEVFDGNGKVNQVFSANLNGKVTRYETISGTYTVDADCTGTATYADGTRFDQFIAPDGSKLTFVQTHPKRFVTASFEPQGTAKRVGD